MGRERRGSSRRSRSLTRLRHSFWPRFSASPPTKTASHADYFCFTRLTPHEAVRSLPRRRSFARHAILPARDEPERTSPREAATGRMPRRLNCRHLPSVMASATKTTKTTEGGGGGGGWAVEEDRRKIFLSPLLPTCYTNLTRGPLRSFGAFPRLPSPLQTKIAAVQSRHDLENHTK